MSEQSSAETVQLGDRPVELYDNTDITGKIMLCVEYTEEEHRELATHPLDKVAIIRGKPTKVRR